MEEWEKKLAALRVAAGSRLISCCCWSPRVVPGLFLREAVFRDEVSKQLGGLTPVVNG